MLIEIKNFVKTYSINDIEVHALNDVSLSIDKGDYVAIMGASGSGKSTLMNMIGLLDRPTSGTYLLKGESVYEMSDDNLADLRNQEIGFVFQSFNLIARQSALKNTELPMIISAELGKKERRERAMELLAEVGLSERADHMPNELSGGQRQRVAIARAMANNPPIILADEPTGNLDSKASIEIMEIFTKLNREKGVTIVLVTHEREIAECCDRIITFKDGRIINDERRDCACVSPNA